LNDVAHPLLNMNSFTTCKSAGKVKTAFKSCRAATKVKGFFGVYDDLLREVRMQILMHFACKGRPGDSHDVSHYLPIGFLQSPTLRSSRKFLNQGKGVRVSTKKKTK